MAPEPPDDLDEQVHRVLLVLVETAIATEPDADRLYAIYWEHPHEITRLLELAIIGGLAASQFHRDQAEVLDHLAAQRPVGTA